MIDYIKNSIASGDMFGQGSGNSADKKVEALINMIEPAGDLLEAGQTAEGCQQLADTYLKVDGVNLPPDFCYRTGHGRACKRANTLKILMPTSKGRLDFLPSSYGNRDLRNVILMKSVEPTSATAVEQAVEADGRLRARSLTANR